MARSFRPLAELKMWAPQRPAVDRLVPRQFGCEEMAEDSGNKDRSKWSWLESPEKLLRSLQHFLEVFFFWFLYVKGA